MPLDHQTLEDDDKRYLWHPFTQQQDWEAEPQLIITRGEGCYLFDDAGNRYLDGVSSLWANLHGHRHPTINAAITRQLEQIAHTTMLGLTHPTAIQLGKRLVELAPGRLSRVFPRRLAKARLSDDGFGDTNRPAPDRRYNAHASNGRTLAGLWRLRGRHSSPNRS